MENLIVQKFSGKVMQDVTTRQLAIRQVKEVLATGHRVIAVVSTLRDPPNRMQRLAWKSW